MVVKEILENGLLRFYSDSSFQIRKDGTDEIYDEAIDLATSGYTYSEIDVKIEDNSLDYIEKEEVLSEILNLIEE